MFPSSLRERSMTLLFHQIPLRTQSNGALPPSALSLSIHMPPHSRMAPPLTHRSAGRLTHWLAVWPAGRLARRSAGLLACRLAEWTSCVDSSDWFARGLVGRLALLSGWRAGELASRLAVVCWDVVGLLTTLVAIG